MMWSSGYPFPTFMDLISFQFGSQRTWWVSRCWVLITLIPSKFLLIEPTIIDCAFLFIKMSTYQLVMPNSSSLNVRHCGTVTLPLYPGYSYAAFQATSFDTVSFCCLLHVYWNTILQAGTFQISESAPGWMTKDVKVVPVLCMKVMFQ